MIRLAVAKGRLWTDSARMLRDLGIPAGAQDRQYAFHHPDLDLEAIVLKPPDIPGAIADGLVDYAVASDEWLAENSGQYDAIVPLCWYHVRVCVLAPVGRATVLQWPPRWSGQVLTVATPYPRLASRLIRTPERFTIRHVAGTAEAYPGKLTDLAVDCVETGATAAANGLVEIAELLRCDVRLVAGPKVDTEHEAARHLRSTVAARAADGHCTFAKPPSPPEDSC